MSNNNYIPDPNLLTFKSNIPLSSIGALTFGSNLKDEIDLPLSKNINITSTGNNNDYHSQAQSAQFAEIIPLAHESYITTILHLLVNILQFKDKICSKIYKQDDPKAKLLFELQSCFNHYSNSHIINSTNLQCLLSKLFKPQGKFILTNPDNPLDAYFILLNSIHNYSIQAYPNDISNQKCNKCLAHKFFYLEIFKREKCICCFQNNTPYPYLTYLLHIPIDKIIQLSKNTNLIEMSKTLKFNSFNFTFESNPQPNNVIGSYEKSKGKLFFYFSSLISDDDEYNKKICRNCNKNYIQKTLFINNLPSFLSFSLSHSNLFSWELNDILETFVLIPTIFEINQLFDNNHPNKAFYEFFAVVMVRKAMNYSIATKCDDTSWKFISIDDMSLQCSSWSEVIEECLKNQCRPIMIVYRIQEKYSHKEKDLNIEDIKRYVKYINSIDQYKHDNPFRTNESIIPIETTNSIHKKFAIGFIDNIRLRTNSSAGNIKSSSISHHSSIKNKSHKLSEVKKEEVIYYNCLFCGARNRIENQNCIMCKKSNKDIISKLKFQYTQQCQNNNDNSSEIKNKKELLKQNLFNKPSSYNQNTNQQMMTKDNKRAIDHQVFDSGNKQFSANRENDPVVIVYNQNDHRNSNTASREVSQENAKNDNRIKYHRKIKRILSNQEWKCDICYHYNKPNVYRCVQCKTMNPFQRDLLQGINVNSNNALNENSNHLMKKQQQKHPRQSPFEEQTQKKQGYYSHNHSKKNSSLKNNANHINSQQSIGNSQYGYSTKLNKRQMSVGNLNKKPFNSERERVIVLEIDISKKKASSIKPKRPVSSNKMILTNINTNTKVNKIRPQYPIYNQKKSNDILIRPKTSIPKHTKNPFT